MMSIPVALLLAATASACAYEPSSFHYPLLGELAGARATTGCLDVAVARVTSVEAEGPVVSIAFGNRCDRAVVVDVTRLRFTGRDEAGRDWPLRLVDPRSEIRPYPMEARVAGRELLELRGGPPVAPREVCVDIGGLAANGASRAEWLCVGAA